MTTDIVHIRKLKRLGGYRLKLWFTDGMAGEWDFSELAGDRGPMAEPFEDARLSSHASSSSSAASHLAERIGDWSEALHADMAAAGVLSLEPVAA